ncbi:phage holin family protein [Sedimentimonas flavescens]|uniref:phage holin family protein n=1 Tax=Sedimentimonas flavescens TaxID=2851012 RepID=UPI001C49FF0F|nr:phage holin family protein [Sedimentimonas flavescens]MBW0158007.1 phage holin family protein [Sedimentimonas flavescens]
MQDDDQTQESRVRGTTQMLIRLALRRAQAMVRLELAIWRVEAEDRLQALRGAALWLVLAAAALFAAAGALRDALIAGLVAWGLSPAYAALAASAGFVLVALLMGLRVSRLLVRARRPFHRPLSRSADE